MAVRGDVYGGSCGQTRTELIHYSCPCGVLFTAHAYRAVNASRDPALGAKLTGGTLQTIACPACGKSAMAELSVVYHDEENRLFVLVLPEARRHAELEERAELLLALARDRGQPVPRYASDFTTVFGGTGLTRLLESRAAKHLEAVEVEARAHEIGEREAALAQREAEITARVREFEHIAGDVDRRDGELRRLEDDLRVRREELAAHTEELGRRMGALDEREKLIASSPRPAAGAAAQPPAASLPDDGTTGPYLRVEDADEHTDGGTLTPTPAMVPAAAPVRRASTSDSNKTRIAPPPGRDVAVERWVVSRKPWLCLVEQGQVRLLTTLDTDRLEPFLAGGVSARIQLHRLPQYPLVVLAVSPEKDDGAEPLAFFLDPQRVDDRSCLGALGHGFKVTLNLYDREYLPVLQQSVAAPLEENVAAIATAAEAHLASISTSQRSFDAALQAWRAPGFDRFGRRAHNLEEDSFALLPTAATTRLALNIVAYWSEPENEDYLLYVRSFPVAWWRRIQGRVIARAVDFGLALPSLLAQLAIKQGLARTRKELAHRLVHAFGDVAAGLKPNDLDPADMTENWRTLVSECEALGVALEGKAGDLAAIAVGAVSAPPPPRAGRPGGTPGFGVPVQQSVAAPAQAGPNGSSGPQAITAPKPRLRVGSPVIAGEIASAQTDGPLKRDLGKVEAKELISLLEDKDLRRDAALELCRRAEPTAVGPVFGALRRMTRGEAVRVLPGVVAFGDRATRHLVDGLRSRKAFVRHGCALALGVLKAADGIEPLCDLLLGEPTDVWREIARAIGEVGPGAVMSLAARLRDQPADRRDRIAWALAHVASRGGRAPVETLSQGRDPVAVAAAQRALELAGDAKLNDAEVRGVEAPRDQTVNRAFSRRFFEAMAGKGPVGAAVRAELRAAGLTNGEEVEISDSELLEDDEEMLDDEDLLPG